MKGNPNLLRQLEGLTGEALPARSVIEIAGDSRVLIEHHGGVREYSRERIGVSVKFGTVQIDGCGLELSRMTREQLVISGRIDGVTLLRRNG